MNKLRRGTHVLVRAGWIRDSQDMVTKANEPPSRISGVVLAILPRFGVRLDLRQEWAVVKWDDRDDPDCFKLAGLEAGR